MNLREIESKLDNLEINKDLHSKEAIDLIEKWVELKSSEYANANEVLEIPNELVFYEDDYFKFIGESEDADIQILFIFQHTGVRLPLDFETEFGFTEWRPIAQSILDNHDIGTRWILNQLVADMLTNKHKFKYAILYYDISRTAADVNRVRVQDQVVDLPYRGVSPWKNSVDKKRISKTIVDPYFKHVEKYVSKSTPEFIFYPHTYDAFGGGNASNGHEIKDKLDLKRPASMIFDYYNLYRTEPYGHYRDEKSARFHFMPKEDLNMVINSQFEHLAQIPNLKEEVEVTVDYPYTSPPQFPGLVHTYTKVPQLLLENRKDLFAEGSDLIYKSIINICNKML